MGSAARLSAPGALVLWAALGAAGPPFWGLVNAAWSLCAVGKRQSPVDVELKRVLYDPFLPPLRLSTGGEKVQLIHFNQELYGNLSAASRGPNGLAILSLFVNTSTQVAGSSNPFLSRLLNRDTITRISYKNDAYFLQDLSLELLFPESFGFITYQGSLSTPPCSETVTWILIDRALNITSLQVNPSAHSPHPCHPNPFPGLGVALPHL
ncbi:Carbonic anhydrase-related protein 11, partial [Camelus dromedarius]